MNKFNREGIAWWNSLSIEERRQAIDAAGAEASAADAYRYHIAERQRTCHQTQRGLTMTKLTDDQISELCIITTRNESGRHFTEFSSHWEALEDAGMIRVHRPVHQPTGIPYSSEYWSVEVTEEGVDLVDANPELHPEN